jgi:hypothetical protein
MTTGLSTVISNGSPVLTAKFDGAKGLVAEFSVDVCPNGATVDMSKYYFKYDLFLKTTRGSSFKREEKVADAYLANNFAAVFGCQPFLTPSSDTWEEGSCGGLSASSKSMTIVVRLPQTWAGDIYIDNARFEPW